MKEFIEKLIGRLEEKFKYNSEQAEIYRDGSDKDAYFREKKDLYMDRANTYGEVMRIVNRLAEEYINTSSDISSGWIACSERLPDESGEYYTYVCYEGSYIYAVDDIDCDGMIKQWNCVSDYHIIAWKPIAPYKEGE